MTMRVHPDVASTSASGGALVALESTLLAHGLPWPDNLEVGLALEQEVRSAGAVPATIAVLDGVARIGLDRDELETVARTGTGMIKAGAADLAVLFARGADAATTVSGTAVLAARAGIRVFATGGIGGVHRGDAGDVSSDLTTLAREPIAVVSAGAKAILDLPRTLEMLETLGVLVIGYGTREFPAFYTRRSGLALEHACGTPDEVARVLRHRWRLGQGGVLLANPIPAEAALDADAIERAIADAVRAADLAHVHGKALTPFLLAELARVTGGASIRANRALVLNNARVAAGIARAYAAIPQDAPPPL